MRFEAEISHRFARFDLDVALTGRDGVTVLFGPSGSGKSTFIRAIAGVLRPDQGRIVLGDDVVFDARAGVQVPAHKRRLGYVFQDGRLFPHLDVTQNLRFGATRGADQIAERDVVELLGLGDLLERRPATLSGGERQRVALGRALLSGPRMLLMDEPLAALDGPRKDEILPYLSQLKSEAGVPILYVTHAVEEVARLADHVVMMQAGRVVQQGPVFDVLSSPDAMLFLGVREAGSILRAQVVSHEDDGLSVLRSGAGLLELPGVDAAVGDSVRVRILARDVILARARPQAMSARNVFETQILQIERGRGPGVAVVLGAGQDRLMARITDRSCNELGLETGQRIFAILKATAVSRGGIGRGS